MTNLELRELKKTMTICLNCIHCFKDHTNSVCKAVENEKTVDPVTGNHVYVNIVDGSYSGYNKYAMCRDINKGNCSYYETMPILINGERKNEALSGLQSSSTRT